MNLIHKIIAFCLESIQICVIISRFGIVDSKGTQTRFKCISMPLFTYESFASLTANSINPFISPDAELAEGVSLCAYISETKNNKKTVNL
ncbi:MAG TPA: hypothetical protein VHP38_01995 [Ruminiclostridium sp.]|nr:hypothetical protein [Ruminiclostridium sp.]